VSVIWAVIFIFGFYVFFAIGCISHFIKRGKKWIFFTLSAFGLIGTILMFILFNWDLGSRINTVSAAVSGTDHDTLAGLSKHHYKHNIDKENEKATKIQSPPWG
jgi:uncharacterized transporter YbjL